MSDQSEFELNIFPELEGKYHVIERIGSGAFSEVFKAITLGIPGKDGKRTGAGKIVALKRLSVNSLPSHALIEIQILKQLQDCSYIPSIYGVEFSELHGCITIVMEYIDHDHFSTYFYKMCVSDIAKYLQALFLILEELHSEHIIHKDLKPANFIHKLGTDSYYLIDFGLATQAPSLKNPELIEPFEQIENYIALNPDKFPKYKPVSTSCNINNVNGNSDSNDDMTDSEDNKGVSVISRGKDIIEGEAMEIKEVDNDEYGENTSDEEEDSGSEVKKKKTVKEINNVNHDGTRGFRAPEILCRSQIPQTTAIDIWSVGVILLCILGREYPFFRPIDDLSNLGQILRCYGITKDSTIQYYDRLIMSNFFPTIRGGIPALLSLYCDVPWPAELLNLLMRCLELDPAKRITAKEALEHPFFSMDFEKCDRELFPLSRPLHCGGQGATHLFEDLQ